MEEQSNRIVAIVVLSATFIAAFHVWALDGIGGVVFGALLYEDTAYSPGYSDSGFRHVAVGMSREQVRR
jgi:hypothetical protein